MIKKLFRQGFSTTADVLSTKNLKKFGCHDYPEALTFSRPFGTALPTQTSPRPAMASRWPHSR
jgi:hypothetical protein